MLKVIFLSRNSFISSSQKPSELGTIITFYRQGNKKTLSRWFSTLLLSTWHLSFQWMKNQCIAPSLNTYNAKYLNAVSGTRIFREYKHTFKNKAQMSIYFFFRNEQCIISSTSGCFISLFFSNQFPLLQKASVNYYFQDATNRRKTHSHSIVSTYRWRDTPELNCFHRGPWVFNSCLLLRRHRCARLSSYSFISNSWHLGTRW